MWTRFTDMHSGGGNKVGPYEDIYIEAPQKEAIRIFRNRFQRSPYHVTCDCCGEDFSISEYDTIQNATGYQRHCLYVAYDNDGNRIPRKTTKSSNENIASWGYVDEPDTSYGYVPIPLETYLAGPYVLCIQASELTSADKEDDGSITESDYD